MRPFRAQNPDLQILPSVSMTQGTWNEHRAAERRAAKRRIEQQDIAYAMWLWERERGELPPHWHDPATGSSYPKFTVQFGPNGRPTGVLVTLKPERRVMLPAEVERIEFPRTR